MIILHAGVLDGGLFVWGETPAEAGAPVRRRGRKPKQPQAAPSPYDAGALPLGEALADVLPTRPVQPGDWQDGVLWLPTVGGRPVPSSPLIADPPEAGTEAALAPWKITALPLPRPQAIELLCACVDRE